MSKYEPLWNYVMARNEDQLTLSFTEVHDILGFDIDHSFLNSKKELAKFHYEVKKISIKNKSILFAKLN